MTRARAHSAAAAVVVATGVFVVAMDWLPTPLNRNIAHVPASQRMPGTLVHGAACTVAAVVLVRGPRWAQRVVPGWFTLVLVSALLNWWVPYVAGRYPGEITPEVFATEYAANVRVLPAWPGHAVVPDVQHSLIHALVAASAALSARAAFGRRRSAQRDRPRPAAPGTAGA